MPSLVFAMYVGPSFRSTRQVPRSVALLPTPRSAQISFAPAQRLVIIFFSCLAIPELVGTCRRKSVTEDWAAIIGQLWTRGRVDNSSSVALLSHPRMKFALIPRIAK